MKIIYHDNLEREIVVRECEFQHEYEAVLDWIEKSSHLLLMSTSGSNVPTEKDSGLN